MQVEQDTNAATKLDVLIETPTFSHSQDEFGLKYVYDVGPNGVTPSLLEEVKHGVGVATGRDPQKFTWFSKQYEYFDVSDPTQLASLVAASTSQNTITLQLVHYHAGGGILNDKERGHKAHATRSVLERCPNIYDKIGYEFLHSARVGCMKCLILLSIRYPNLIHLRSLNKGYTALDWAIFGQQSLAAS
jgi:hypothetical protein